MYYYFSSLFPLDLFMDMWNLLQGKFDLKFPKSKCKADIPEGPSLHMRESTNIQGNVPNPEMQQIQIHTHILWSDVPGE